jgi:hypothetical protein
MSIKHVPGTQVVFEDFVGEEGFLKACQMAVEGNLPEIKLKEPKKHKLRLLSEVMREIENIKQKKEVK